MAVTQVKPIFLNADGVYQGVTDGADGNYVAVSRLSIDSGTPQSYPQLSNTTDAATVGYVNAAIEGIDYKQECDWYFQQGGVDLAAFLTILNSGVNFAPATNITNIIISGGAKFLVTSASHGLQNGANVVIAGVTFTGTDDPNNTWVVSGVTTNTFEVGSGVTSFTYVSGGTALWQLGPSIGELTAGERILFISDTATESGIYVFSGADASNIIPTVPGTWALTRAADMATGSSAAGAWTFCRQEISVAGVGYFLDYTTINTAYICTNAQGSAVVGTDPLTFAVYGVSTVYTGAAPITVAGTVIGLDYNNTLGLDGSNKLTVLQSPTTAVDLPRTGADLTAGLAVRYSTSASLETASDIATDPQPGQTFGIVLAGGGFGSQQVVTSGLATLAAAPLGSPVIGDNVYLAAAGAVQTYAYLLANDASGSYVTKVGKYTGPSGPGGTPQISVSIQEFGLLP